MSYLFLFIAIVAEVIGTSLIYTTHNFTKPIPSFFTILAYAISFYTLSFAMKQIPVGIVYATWSGMGIVMVSIIALIAYKQKLDAPALIGMGLILSGVLVMNLLSKSLHPQ